ncbi:flagellar hook-length control protein FliK [Gammaproteobacteria bacterium]|nr:flagellar hook-length control protein FliK [Gammaproteobacteria bacterium]MDB9758686.1 flagellar hook-length control protein FliK [Gammaproteobacteria bacterium]MDC1422184.1 flagellar hook-length control protein FliK [Gammaproteobacteria bacterium]MDC1511146.1 flagellar hook-length control protein FliK [Gammaproteobacteria bacterium]
MNISSKYDLGDIVNQLGSSSAVKPGAEKGAEGIFAVLISNLAVAGITGKVADEVAEAVEGGGDAPLSQASLEFLAGLKRIQNEGVGEPALPSSSEILKNPPFDGEASAGEDNQGGLGGLIAFLEQRTNAVRASAEVKVPAADTKERQINLLELLSKSEKGVRADEKLALKEINSGARRPQAGRSLIDLLSAKADQLSAANLNPTPSSVDSASQASQFFAEMLTGDTFAGRPSSAEVPGQNKASTVLAREALRITTLKESRTVLLGPGPTSVAPSRVDVPQPRSRASLEGFEASRNGENQGISLENKLFSAPEESVGIQASEDSPEYWNQETKRLLSEMGRTQPPISNDNAVSIENASIRINNVSNSDVSSLAETSERAVKLNYSPPNGMTNGQSERRNDSHAMSQARVSNTAATIISNETSLDVENKRTEQQTVNSQTSSHGQVNADSLKSSHLMAMSGQAQRPLRFNVGNLEEGDKRINKELNVTEVKPVATEEGDNLGRKLAATDANGPIQLDKTVGVMRHPVSESRANNEALAPFRTNQQFASIQTPESLAATGSALAVAAQSAKEVSRATVTDEFSVDAKDPDSFLGQIAASKSALVDNTQQRVAINNLPQGIATHVNTHLAKGLGAGPTKISISLFPENYGQVDVEFVYSEEAGLRINLSSENAETAKLLQSNTSGLKESLMGGAFANVSVDVNAQSHGKQESGGPQQQDSRQEQKTAKEGEVAVSKQPASELGTETLGGLDTFV